VLAEEGAFFDQPAYYIEMMTEMDSAIGDSYSEKDKISKEADIATDALRARGINFTPKN
jgi:hypothetical protein